MSAGLTIASDDGVSEKRQIDRTVGFTVSSHTFKATPSRLRPRRQVNWSVARTQKRRFLAS